MGKKVRSGERKKKKKKKERTQVKIMAYRVALGARKACGARNTGVPKSKYVAVGGTDFVDLTVRALL